MKITRLLLLPITLALGALVASAQQVPAEAFIYSVDGQATVTLPGSSKAVPAVAGQRLPEGSAIATADGAHVLVQSHEGVQTGLGPKTSAVVGVHAVSAEGVRTAVIDLKSGTTVSVLDPSKRSVNNYAIRTPKGVAAARGTTYTTTVKLSSGGEATVIVNTVTGEVSFSLSEGPTVSVAAGRSASSRDASVKSIADATKDASPAEKQAIAEALQSVVTVVAAIAQVGNNETGARAQNLLNTVVENVTKAANEIAKTDPELAKTIVTNTVDAVQTYAGNSGNSALATINRVASNDVKDAVQQAVDTPETPVTVTTVPNPNGSGPSTIIIPPSTTSPNQVDPTIVSPTR